MATIGLKPLLPLPMLAVLGGVAPRGGFRPRGCNRFSGSYRGDDGGDLVIGPPIKPTPT